ncbi:MAG: flagellar motor switch protein FliM [Acidobacteriota bacterium]
MERILSQDEINALFSSMSASRHGLLGSAASAPTARGTVARYDFCRSDRISKDQIRSLHLLHSNFVRSFSSSMSAYLRTMAEVQLASIEQSSYTEFLKGVSDPTLYCSVQLPPMSGNVALEISPSLAFPMIDMLLGGPGNAPSENRPLTEIEIHIMEGVVRLLLRDLKDSWRSVQELEPRLEGLETKPQMLQIVAPGEAVVVIRFEIKLGETSGVASLCLPSMMLKMNRTRFDQPWHQRAADVEGRESKRIRELVRGLPVNMSAEMHDKNLRIEDLLSIGTGDVLQLDRCVGDPVLLCIGGVPKYLGRIVVRRGKKAFEITEGYEP